MTQPSRVEESTGNKVRQRYPAHVANAYLYSPRAGGAWIDMASAWDAFGRWARQRYRDGRSGDDATDALYRDQAIILQDLWVAVEKFESEVPEEKLPRQQRLFDIDKVRRVS
jgi:hypothetical protein